MRALGFRLGLALLVLGAAAGFAELVGLLVRPGNPPVSVGSIWAGVHAGSLAGLRALVEGGAGPRAWAPVGAALVWPAWLTLTLPGTALALGCRPRGRGGAGGFERGFSGAYRR